MLKIAYNCVFLIDCPPEIWISHNLKFTRLRPDLSLSCQTGMYWAYHRNYINIQQLKFIIVLNWLKNKISHLSQNLLEISIYEIMNTFEILRGYCIRNELNDVKWIIFKHNCCNLGLSTPRIIMYYLFIYFLLEFRLKVLNYFCLCHCSMDELDVDIGCRILIHIWLVLYILHSLGIQYHFYF